MLDEQVWASVDAPADKKSPPSIVVEHLQVRPRLSVTVGEHVAVHETAPMHVLSRQTRPAPHWAPSASPESQLGVAVGTAVLVLVGTAVLVLVGTAVLVLVGTAVLVLAGTAVLVLVAGSARPAAG